jgi:hypothetical protein
MKSSFVMRVAGPPATPIRRPPPRGPCTRTGTAFLPCAACWAAPATLGRIRVGRIRVTAPSHARLPLPPLLGRAPCCRPSRVSCRRVSMSTGQPTRPKRRVLPALGDMVRVAGRAGRAPLSLERALPPHARSAVARGRGSRRRRLCCLPVCCCWWWWWCWWWGLGFGGGDSVGALRSSRLHALRTASGLAGWEGGTGGGREGGLEAGRGGVRDALRGGIEGGRLKKEREAGGVSAGEDPASFLQRGVASPCFVGGESPAVSGPSIHPPHPPTPIAPFPPHNLSSVHMPPEWVPTDPSCTWRVCVWEGSWPGAGGSEEGGDCDCCRLPEVWAIWVVIWQRGTERQEKAE